MTDEQKAAYVMAMAACAMAEIEAMKAKNTHDAMFENHLQTFSEKDFRDVIERNCIHHNAILTIFHGS